MPSSVPGKFFRPCNVSLRSKGKARAIAPIYLPLLVATLGRPEQYIMKIELSLLNHAK